jgi:hypothetical protein
MPPTTVHFNGGVNLANAEAVLREIASRVPSGVRRVPDGETGDRQQWIFYQLQKFWQTPGLEEAGTTDRPAEGYEALPTVRLADGVDPEALSWPNLGYADAYQESFETFQRLRKEGILAGDIRFQVQYPTPLASVAAWLVTEDQDRTEPSYERALFADLDRLLAALPHDGIAVQWDVAVEFGLLEGGFSATETQTFEGIIERLARCVDRVPTDAMVGMHLCYGDYQHRHFKEPESLELQVRVANALKSAAHRTVDWFAFTVPQYQREPSFFAPLRNLQADDATELYFALVPYHPAQQQPGTTGEQVRLIDEYLGRDTWGICTECGMARAEPEEIPVLLDQHREILATYAS